MSFRCAGAVFRELLRLRCKYNGIRVLRVFVLRCFAWNAHASVCSSVVFVGPVVQSACFDLLLSKLVFARIHCHSIRERFRGHVATFCALSGESLSLWRGASFQNAKRTLCALWVGRIAPAVGSLARAGKSQLCGTSPVRQVPVSSSSSRRIATL